MNFSYNSTEWYFTTLETPWWDQPGWDGPHPVSGNRAFGIKQNPDGSFTIYTRGVDRVTLRIEEIAGGILSYIGNNGFNPFSKADELWNAFQDNLVDFIEFNGGQATKVSVEPKRVDLGAVRDYLMEN